MVISTSRRNVALPYQIGQWIGLYRQSCGSPTDSLHTTAYSMQRRPIRAKRIHFQSTRRFPTGQLRSHSMVVLQKRLCSGHVAANRVFPLASVPLSSRQNGDRMEASIQWLVCHINHIPLDSLSLPPSLIYLILRFRKGQQQRYLAASAVWHGLASETRHKHSLGLGGRDIRQRYC